MKHEPVKDHAERKRIFALIERCEKEQTMSRYIDADALIADMQERLCKPCKADGRDHHEVACRACWVDDAMIEIDLAPTIDAESVVRCKDCRWSEPNEFDDYDCRCHIPIFRVNADGFCSYGEREGE